MTATEKPTLPPKALTLYGIETELLELLNFRESIESDPDMTPQEQQESLKACDESIVEYIRAEVKKCDGIAAYIREFDSRAALLEEEADRCKEMARVWQKRKKSLESMVIDIMQVTKQTRIDGRHSVLALKKNPASVDVAQPHLVPAEYERVNVTVRHSLWTNILALVVQAARRDTTIALLYAEMQDPDKIQLGAPEPMKKKIAEELKVGGSVPGCRLRTDSVRLEVK